VASTRTRFRGPRRFSLDAVYDIITTASIYNYNNRLAEAAGHIPDRANHGLFR
jgi:hypothetical protein